MYSYCKEKAFTLVELIITLSILAILVSFAYPAFQDFKAKQESNHIVSLLKLLNQSAKSNAVIYHSNIIICSSSNLKQCRNNQWNSGIIMFSDRNKNQQVDPSETIHFVTDTKLKYGSLNWVGGVTSSKFLTYLGDTGLPHSSFGHFSYCSQHAQALHRQITLPKTGNMSIKNSTC